jgi:hypothetical protein
MKPPISIYCHRADKADAPRIAPNEIFKLITAKPLQSIALAAASGAGKFYE